MNFAPLETEGGKMFIILMSLAFLSVIAVIMHLLGKDPAETGRTLEASLFTGLTALLLAKLGSKDKP